MLKSRSLLVTISLCCLLRFINPVRAGDTPQLAEHLAPWLRVIAGQQEQFVLSGSGSLRIDDKAQAIEFKLIRYDQHAFDLSLAHTDYSFQIRRRIDGIALALPKHHRVFIGTGETDSQDHLEPAGIIDRLVSTASSVRVFTTILGASGAEQLVGTLTAMTKVHYQADEKAWVFNNDVRVVIDDATGTIQATIDETPVILQLDQKVPSPPLFNEWPGLAVHQIPRREIEQQLVRGTRRALEILAPAGLLTAPNQRPRRTEHGELRWIDGQRVALLHGTPQQIGEAHGKLLKNEAMRCIDSVLYTFGTAQTVATGKWFREELEKAYARLSPHIPERHKVETRALAASLGQDPHLIEALNVFPELFHCSGFAVFGSATKDGKLYHGRVLDYMTTIGLQDSATTFIVAAEGQIPFANVGYGGFIGSVSGMNAAQISLGEMGGRGEGQWDGVPMATLMRRALEECSSLEQVQQLWRDNPRTCEYYYVFADGKDRTSVGVAATPQSVEFIKPGQGHELLGDGIEDAVVLSAGSRLEELRRRVKEKHGSIDVDVAQWLMSRPVAMTSNLHNVLFVPEDGLLYVANADHQRPAAERPYAKIDLKALLKELPVAPEPNRIKSTTFKAHDTLNPGVETIADAQECLHGLTWQPTSFNVTLETTEERHGDLRVRFPSSIPSGIAKNDLVAMEWYQPRDESGEIKPGPAVVVVHESGSNMTVGRMIAVAMRGQGVHSFMIQLPYYGLRRGEVHPDGEQIIAAMRQSVADVRRVRDAVASLPYVDVSNISLQGTSLGGFVAATTAGLDSAFDRVFVMLAGGDLYDVLSHGQRDAAKMRDRLIASGMTEERLKQLLSTIEPLRLAHRLNADQTWLFSAKYDEVVPPRNAGLLATAAHLAPSHHVQLIANHYTGIVFLPMITQQMRDIILPHLLLGDRLNK